MKKMEETNWETWEEIGTDKYGLLSDTSSNQYLKTFEGLANS